MHTSSHTQENATSHFDTKPRARTLRQRRVGLAGELEVQASGLAPSMSLSRQPDCLPRAIHVHACTRLACNVYACIFGCTLEGSVCANGWFREGCQRQVGSLPARTTWRARRVCS